MTDNERRQRLKYIIVIVATLGLVLVGVACLGAFGWAVAFKEDLDRAWWEVESARDYSTRTECLRAMSAYEDVYDQPGLALAEMLGPVRPPDPSFCHGAAADYGYDDYAY